VDTSISELDAAITGKPPPAKKKCGILKQGSILCNSDSIVKKKAEWMKFKSKYDHSK